MPILNRRPVRGLRRSEGQGAPLVFPHRIWRHRACPRPSDLFVEALFPVRGRSALEATPALGPMRPNRETITCAVVGQEHRPSAQCVGKPPLGRLDRGTRLRARRFWPSRLPTVLPVPAVLGLSAKAAVSQAGRIPASPWRVAATSPRKPGPELCLGGLEAWPQPGRSPRPPLRRPSLVRSPSVRIFGLPAWGALFPGDAAQPSPNAMGPSGSSVLPLRAKSS